MALVGTREVNNVELQLHASRHGMWLLLEEVEEGKTKQIGQSHEKLDNVIASARIELNKRKVKVEVPFVTMQGERGVATGFHARTGQVLSRIKDKPENFDKHAQVLKADIPREKLDRMLVCYQRANTLRTEARRIQEEYSMRLGSEVEKAIEQELAVKERVLASTS